MPRKRIDKDNIGYFKNPPDETPVNSNTVEHRRIRMKKFSALLEKEMRLFAKRGECEIYSCDRSHTGYTLRHLTNFARDNKVGLTLDFVVDEDDSTIITARINKDVGFPSIK